MEALRQLFLTLGLDADETKFASAQAAVDGVEKALELAKEAAEALSEAFREAIFGTAEYADKLVDTAEAAGLSAEQLQELVWAGAQSGVGLAEISQAAERLSRAMYDVTKGGEESARMFGALGVRVTDAHGKLRPTQEVMLDVAEAFKKMPAGAERTAKAMEIFGRSGARMIPLLSEGREGLERFGAEAHQAGVVMGEEALEKAKSFADGLGMLKEALAGIAHEVGGRLIQELDPLLKRLNDWLVANRKLIGQRLDELVVKPLAASIKALDTTLAFFLKHAQDFIDIAKVLAVVVGSVLVAAFVAAQGGLVQMLVFTALNVASLALYAAQVISVAAASAAAWLVAAWPIIAVAAAIALVVLGIDELWTMLEGGDSLLGRLIKWFDHPSLTDNAFMRMLKAVGSVLFDLTDTAKWERLGKAILDFLVIPLKWLVETFPSLRAQASVGGASPGDGQRAKFPGLNDVLGPASTSPAGTAAAQQAAGGMSPYVAAPFTMGDINVTVGPGQNADQVAQQLGTHLESRWDEWFSRRLSSELPVVR